MRATSIRRSHPHSATSSHARTISPRCPFAGSPTGTWPPTPPPRCKSRFRSPGRPRPQDARAHGMCRTGRLWKQGVRDALTCTCQCGAQCGRDAGGSRRDASEHGLLLRLPCGAKCHADRGRRVQEARSRSIGEQIMRTAWYGASGGHHGVRAPSRLIVAAAGSNTKSKSSTWNGVDCPLPSGALPGGWRTKSPISELRTPNTASLSR
jgi:hypothetical protein